MVNKEDTETENRKWAATEAKKLEVYLKRAGIEASSEDCAVFIPGGIIYVQYSHKYVYKLCTGGCVLGFNVRESLKSAVAVLSILEDRNA